MLMAQSRGDRQWYNLFLWIGCYLLAIVIDATFDVALEGPMLGIWFWCLFGFGIGTTMVYRAMVTRSRVASKRTPGDPLLRMPPGMLGPRDPAQAKL